MKKKIIMLAIFVLLFGMISGLSFGQEFEQKYGRIIIGRAPGGETAVMIPRTDDVPNYKSRQEFINKVKQMALEIYEYRVSQSSLKETILVYDDSVMRDMYGHLIDEYDSIKFYRIYRANLMVLLMDTYIYRADRMRFITPTQTANLVHHSYNMHDLKNIEDVRNEYLEFLKELER